MTDDKTCPAANWNYPTQVRFGPGRLRELPDACRTAGIARPLLVTDPGLAGMPMVKRALELLDSAAMRAALFADLRPNPVYRNVEDGMRAFRSGRHDGVVAIGGGSGLDTGKAIAFQVGQKRPIWDFEDIGDWWRRADTDAIAPVVAVPTTAGTGSEVGRAAVILNEETSRKYIIFHPRMMPRVVISDPELTTGLPPYITAATGMDALAHNLEAYCALGYHPLAEGIALEGMRLIQAYLPRAYDNGRDIEARSRMLAAASMGATAFQKGLGAVHAIAHPVGAHYNTHHGLTNAVLLPYVIAHNRPAIESQLPVVARALNLTGEPFGALFEWVLGFRRRLGIPHTLAEIGVPLTNPDVIGHEAFLDPSASGNPRPTDAATYARIFRSAVKGDLTLGA